MNPKKFKIGLIVSYFDSANELRRCMEYGRLHMQFDVIYGLDGRYKFYKSDHDYSEDGSNELMERRYGAKIFKYTGEQWKKRQIGLDEAAKDGCDFVMIMDSDDYVHPDPRYQNWDLFFENLYQTSINKPEEKLFTVLVYMDPAYRKAYNQCELGQWKEWGKIIKDPGSVKYALKHHWVFCDKDKDETKKENWLKYNYLIDGVKFATDSKLRTKEQLAVRDQWALANHKWENEILWGNTLNDSLKNDLKEFFGITPYQ